MSLMMRRGSVPVYSLPSSNLPYERRKTIINANLINNINSNINNINTIDILNAINLLNSTNNSKNNFNMEIDQIFQLIKAESKTSASSIDSYQSIKLLAIYIRKNRNNIDITVKKISDILESCNDLNDKIIIYIIEVVLNLITENSQIINFLNRILPILINILTQKNIDLTSIENINNILGKLIKLGGTYTRKIVEINLERLLNKFLNENKSFKYENTKFAYIQFLCVIIQNSPLVAFAKLIQPNTFNIFLRILDNFKDPKIEIRITIGELVVQFIYMLANRDKNMKSNYIAALFTYIFNQYEKHLKENNDIPNNINIFSGLTVIIQKVYIASPSFLKNESIYINLLKNIIKSKNSKNISLKIEFLKIIPKLYTMNKEIFTKKYLKFFFDYFTSLLNIKTNSDLRNALFLTIGNFSLILKKNEFEPILEPLLNLIKVLLIDKKIFDKEIFKCLSDLLNNKDNLYSEKIFLKLDFNFLLTKLFKTKISSYKIEFLNSIMKAFSNSSTEHLSTAITSLNVISLILCDEDFNLNKFYSSNGKLINKTSSENIENILLSTKKYIKKYFSQKNENFESGSDLNLGLQIQNKNIIVDYKKDSANFSKCKCLNEPKLMKCALSLFGRIENEFFFEDMLIFYKEKILPFLYFINNNKVIKKILDLMLCKFIKIYESDKNLSEYIINNILDALKNLIFTFNDTNIVLYAFNILHQKKIFLELLLNNKKIFFNKIFGMLSSNIVSSDLKEKLVQTIGLLAMKSNDKGFFVILIRKNINSLLFSIQNNEDIIQKENNILLLLYYCTYVKFLFDFNLIEQIMEINIDLLLNNEYQGIISMNILKIFCELLNADIINEQSGKINNDKFNEYFQLLLTLCIIEIKDGGINTKKTETSLRTLYQIIKFKKIDIYKKFSPQFSQKMKKSLTNSSIFKEKSENRETFGNNIDELLANERGEKINLIEILLQNVIKGATDECLTIIMNIFGLCGAMEPSKMEKYFSKHGLSIYHLEGNLREEDSIDDNEFKIISTKKNKNSNKNFSEIDLSSIDPSTSKAVLSLMRILKENSQQEVSSQIVSSLSSIIKALTLNEENLIDIILPTIIEVIPQFEINYQKSMFDNINLIINNFKNKIKFYLEDIVQLIINFIMNDNYLNIICQMFKKLFTYYTYEMEIYYPILIPIFLNLIKQKGKEIESLIEIFTLIANNKNIASYLNIMITELAIVYLDDMDKIIIQFLLEFFSKIISLENVSMFYSVIINILLQKLKIITEPKFYSIEINKLSREKKLEHIFRASDKAKLNSLILSESMNIFIKMNNCNKNDFIEYLPLIVNILKETNFLYYGDIKTQVRYSLLEYFDYKFISNNDYIDNILNQFCVVNCIRGFYPLERENKNIKLKQNIVNHSNNIINNTRNNKDMIRFSTNLTINKYLSNQSIKNRKTQIDNELILKIFDNSNCLVEEDWHDWFKSSSKILFEQSPSYILYNCHLLSDYYFPLILELYNYGFFTVYINNNDKNKMILTQGLISALTNPKTPNDILLTILNLIEFIERRNVNLCYDDYSQFGKVAYKCRAFAKALYYKENDFLLKNDYEQFEDLLEIYYEVKQKESAKGLIELVNKNLEKNKEIQHQKSATLNISTKNIIKINKNLQEKNKFIWYIKIHEYAKALKLLDKQILKEENKENYEILKKNRIICLNGLCDWEKLFEEGSNSNNNVDIYDDINNNIINTDLNNNENSEIGNSLQKTIEEEIILSKACLNLNQWIELKNHFYKIHSLFKDDNNDFFEQNLINENENDNLGKKSDLNEDEKAENDLNNFLKNHGQGGANEYIENDLIDNYSINNRLLMNNNNNYDIRKKSNFLIQKSVILSKDTNYKTNPMSLVNQTYNCIINEAAVNKTSININMNENNILFNNEQFDFVSYDKIINNNPIFSFIDNSPEIIFDLNLYSSIINIHDENYENALKFIISSKKLILPDIKSLLSESYTRGYELLIKNQLLCLLEQIIEYKQFHDNDELYLNQMVNFWNQGLEMVGKDDPVIYEKFLSLRALVLPIQKEYEKFMDLAKIYRKMGQYEQSEKILNRIQKKLNLNSADYLNSESKNIQISDEIKIRINLSLNQCLFEKGKIEEAINKSENLVDLLNDAEEKNNILNNKNDDNQNVILMEEEGLLLDEYRDLSKLNNKIKSKIYGNYAIYKQSTFNFEKSNLKYILKNWNITKQENKNNKNLRNIIGRKTVLINSPDFKNKLSCKNLNNIMFISEEEEEEESNNDNPAEINNNFILATKYNSKSFKYWHNYALFNYKFYTYLLKAKNSLILVENISNNNLNYNDCEITYAINAVNGFKNSLSIGGKNKNKTFQDLLRLIDIFFTSAHKNKELLNSINICFNDINIDSFLNVIPQLLCRFDITEYNVLSVLILLLIKIGKAHPRAIIFHLIVMKNSNSRKRISVSNQILNALMKNNEINKKLVEESEMFINELNTCAILLHEQWSEAIEETSKMYYNKDYIGTVKHLIKLHKKMHKNPENNYDIHFYQKYISDIFIAENYLQDYMDNNYIESLNEAWDIYLRLYRNITESYKKFESLSLEYISAKLSMLRNSIISLPGTYGPLPSQLDIYEEDESIQNEFTGVRIKKMGKILKIFNTKQHPRQLSMIGTDDKEYLFLLKGHEDLHQDERAMQLFNLVNTILANNKLTSNKNLFIDTFSVFPLSHSTGIIGWVPGCDTLHQLIKEKREISNTIPNIEHRKMFKLCSKYESCNFLYKVEIFKESIKDLPGLELNNIIWIKSKNCETWLIRRTNYSRSLAVMSMVGYILGLGDRHPSNLMMSRKTGKIIHIDFGDCFEVAMKRDKFPEKVPFRLTRMLVKALEVSGVEGTFRIICEKVMELMRENKDSLLAILGSFLYDPLISFRLMIPMIIKQKKIEESNLKNKKIIKKESNLDYHNYIQKSKYYLNNLSSSVKLKKNPFLKFNSDQIEVNENKENDLISSPKKGRKEEKDEINEEKEKNEKKMMENDERYIFNIYEENDEIESEELNKIAKLVLERINNKLSGTEFYPDIVYEVKEQVNKLINDAISYENLAQSYLGWCPFW